MKHDQIQRYLQAVEFWLPRAASRDIVAELSADLDSEIEEQEGALGRPLQPSEIDSILIARGRPILVANRYQPQRHLIGPVLFPLYSFCLKVMLAIFLIPTIGTKVGLYFFDPAHSLMSWGELMSSLVSGAFASAGAVTLAFAILERFAPSFLERWHPRELQPVRKETNVFPRSSSVGSLAANLIFLVWGASMLSKSTIHIGPKIAIALTPFWSNLLPIFLVLAVLNIGLAAVNLLRPHRTKQREIAQLVLEALGAIPFCLLWLRPLVGGVTIENAPPEKVAQISDALNRGLAQMFPWSVLVCCIIVGAGVYRVFFRRRESNLNGSPATSS